MDECLKKALFFRPLHLDKKNPFWVGHLPFAYWLVAVLRPRLTVELGTHTGNSYFTFCQSIDENGVGGRIFAVDNWVGDPHVGRLDEDCFALVSEVNRRYASFSTLIRDDFNNAVREFQDGSIDLLHIDGDHTYEAVKNDFYTWLPKLTNNAVVLFHDISAQRESFGVDALWSEINEIYPLTYSFEHSFGLGVLQLGEQPRPPLEQFFNGGGSIPAILKNAGEVLSHKVKIEMLPMSSEFSDEYDVFDATLGEINSLKAIKDELTANITQLKLDISKREVQLAEFHDRLAERDEQLAGLKQGGAERDEQLAGLKQAVAERDEQLAGLKQAVAERDEQVSNLHQSIVELRNSTSWKMTAPLRLIKTIIVKSYSWFRKKISDAVRWAWCRFPLPLSIKRGIKGLLFTFFPFLFFYTQAYKRWKAFEASQSQVKIQAANEPYGMVDDATMGLANPLRASEKDSSAYVPRLSAKPRFDAPVKLIAFYLPQFHPIPENDEWWGEGFTEWTNVRSALPQFDGHYQPHVPESELGYYDLRDVNVMQKQAELAKLYGVGGFCFYFYWFGGKRLLESPILQYLESDIDFPFCLCWANENWSRRWDGLDSEILIAQKHSVADDLAFIEYVSRYLKDERYIRINGKPLLLVYRPSELPAPRQTVKRWRKWCRENGVGEIYIAYTQSFESVNPEKYGFDAAIEFPPNNTAPPLITDQIQNKKADFAGQIYDWRVFPERSESYKACAYTLFRGVNPSWDNTARRKSNGTILHGSSPLGYQKWLYNAALNTIKSSVSQDERLVFVNAWNEWAEGAHLEPDKKYGYAYLEATRQALLRLSLRCSNDKKRLYNRLAIIIHAFYIEVFAEILEYVSRVSVNVKLYVTTIHKYEKQARLMLDKIGYDYCLLVVDNHGRDVLPFLKVMPDVLDDGFEVILKLHTKKSKHRNDGDLWRRDVLECLTQPAVVDKVLASMVSNRVGIVGPEGHVVPMSFYWGSNREKVLSLACRMGMGEEEVMKSPFVAGTMFYSTVDSLRPLLDLGLEDKMFEPELGQVDGTLAHAVERAIAVSARSIGKDIYTINKSAVLSNKVCELYQYAERTGARSRLDQ